MIAQSEVKHSDGCTVPCCCCWKKTKYIFTVNSRSDLTHSTAAVGLHPKGEATQSCQHTVIISVIEQLMVVFL